MKAPASNRLRGIDELILIIFSLLWKPYIRAGMTPARDGGLRGRTFEYFCACAQSETSSSGCGESASRATVRRHFIRLRPVLVDRGLSMLRDGCVAVVLVGAFENGLGKRKLEHDLALVIGHFEDRPHQVLHSLDPQKLMDLRGGNLPGAIRVAQLFAFRIGDHLVTDSRIEKVSRHGRTCFRL